jgi:16S rRNA (cytosine1402-N4)-methyltransferase
MTETLHIPVLLEETMNYLNIGRKGVYVDCTIGIGGHSIQILKRNPGARVIGLDIDEQSLQEAKKRFAPYAERVLLYHSDFRYLPDLDVDFSSIKGLFLDLGLSSFQLDTPERGFSFNREGPLDMRMDLRNNITASKIINKSSERKLAEIFREFGELRQASRLAREIVSSRKTKAIKSTSELRRLTEKICRWRPQKGRIHPAAKVFQALRIEVNQELKGLSEFLERMAKKIAKEARIAAISFHSLEDRIIKHTFNRLAQTKDAHPLLRILTKKPVVPTLEEILSNPRARSAKLRAAEKI